VAHGGGPPGSVSRARLPRVRLFVAVRPPDEVLDVLAGLQRVERQGVRWTTRDQWHVTLRFLGEVEDPAPVAAALDEASLAACSAEAGPRVAVLGRNVVVPVAGVEALAVGVIDATRGFGAPAERRRFRGHLTMARVSRGRTGGLVGEPIGVRFPVDDVRLVRSHLGAGGARYEDVHVRRLG
jgi:RNA 2',3'-cyclic 3'-phosphodiesterase